MRYLYTIFCLLLTISIFAQSHDELNTVQLQAEVSTSPAQIILTWDDDVPTSTTVTLYRRAVGSTSWGTAIASVPAAMLSYTDSDVEINTLYEYRANRSSSGGTGRGYIYAGIEVEAPVMRGILIVVVEAALLPELSPEIARYRRDVSADGWRVKQIVVDASDEVTAVKEAIINVFNQAPTVRHALFLLGDIPVPYSGNIFPDGHNDHQGAWSADTYYGELDGNWTDVTINNTSASNARNHNVPGDGKWDQSTIASDLELEVGRVDLYNLPHFTEDAVTLTRRYLDKNHDFRRANFRPISRGLIENNFASFIEGFGQTGLKNFATMVGRDSTSYLDYNTLLNTSYLLSYGCGGGNYQGASGISNTTAMATDSFQTVFTFLFGSYFGDWDTNNNFLRAALGSGTVLTNAWAGRPHWTVHPMGMGYTIGYCAKLTQNNSGSSYSQGFGSRNIHVALMGDPTLRMHIIAPPATLSIEEMPAGNSLTWMAPAGEEDILGYHLYRRSNDSTAYERLTTEPIIELTYLDACPMLGDSLQYLVKAVRMETTPSGTFYNESTGADVGVLIELDRSVTADFTFAVDENEVQFINESDNATTYSWDFGDGTFSNESMPLHAFANGIYQVALIASNDCQSDTTYQQVEVMTVDTDELARLGITVFPNPVTYEQVHLQFPEQLAVTEVELLDAAGRRQRYYPTPSVQQMLLEVSDLPAGWYQLRLRVGGVQYQQPIVIVR